MGEKSSVPENRVGAGFDVHYFYYKSEESRQLEMELFTREEMLEDIKNLLSISQPGTKMLVVYNEIERLRRKYNA